jgi:hypothetical protein
MIPITVMIVEDSKEFSDGLKGVLESQTIFPCTVHVLNPAGKSRAKPPTFEEFYDEIEQFTEKAWPFYIVVMDNDLSWKWKGANLAPSFSNVMAISTDENAGRWADYVFAEKADTNSPSKPRLSIMPARFITASGLANSFPTSRGTSRRFKERKVPRQNKPQSAPTQNHNPLVSPPEPRACHGGVF